MGSVLRCIQLLIIVVCFVLDVASFKFSRTASSATSNRNQQLELTRAYELDKDAIRSTELSSSHLKFTICGGGAFSLAIAKVLSYKNISVSMLVRNQTVADHINTYHYHPKYLTDCLLPSQLWATSDPQAALANADYIVHAVPCQESRKFLTQIREFMPPNAPIMSVTKGVEEGTFCLMNDIITETLGTERRCAYLSGPSFAREIMGGEATAVVIASEDHLAGELSKIMSSTQFRCHTSRDIKVCLSIMSIFVILSFQVYHFLMFSKLRLDLFFSLPNICLIIFFCGSAGPRIRRCRQKRDRSCRRNVRGTWTRHERHVVTGH